ncbi:endopeptidase [Clostridium sp. JNZ X4-2]
MGHYDSEYEKYYNSLKGKVNHSPYYNKLYDRNNSHAEKANYLSRRIIRDLTGALILFAFIAVCKLVSTTESKNVYNYSKKVVSENYDYSKLKTQIKNINIKYIGDRAKSVIEQLRVDEKN